MHFPRRLLPARVFVWRLAYVTCFPEHTRPVVDKFRVLLLLRIYAVAPRCRRLCSGVLAWSHMVACAQAERGVRQRRLFFGMLEHSPLLCYYPLHPGTLCSSYPIGLQQSVIPAVSAQPARVVRDVIDVPAHMRCTEQRRCATIHCARHEICCCDTCLIWHHHKLQTFIHVHTCSFGRKALWRRAARCVSLAHVKFGKTARINHRCVFQALKSTDFFGKYGKIKKVRRPVHPALMQPLKSMFDHSSLDGLLTIRVRRFPSLGATMLAQPDRQLQPHTFYSIMKMTPGTVSKPSTV